MIQPPRFTVEDLDRDVEFRPIDGFTGYLLGTDGTLWSCKRGGWKRRKTRRGRGGYPRVKLSRNGEVFDWPLHLVMMRTFVGPPPTGMEVCHNDGTRTNCSLSNLRYDTHKGNHQDRLAHGTSNAGERNGMRSLTEEDVRAIRRRFQAGELKAALIRDYGVGRRAIERIVRGERWGHVR